MQNLSKYQGQIYVSSTTNRKINAFGHALNTQSYLIDEALMKATPVRGCGESSRIGRRRPVAGRVCLSGTSTCR